MKEDLGAGGPSFSRETTARSHSINKITRRKFLLASAGVVSGLTAAWLIEGGFETLTNLAEKKPTKEQKEAALFLAGDTNFVENLIVLPIRRGDKIIPINLRNKPRVPFDNTDVRAGEKIGELVGGTKIKKAVVVEGNNPFDSRDRNSKSNWYAFYDPNKPDTVVFAWAGYFKPDIDGDTIGEVEAPKMVEPSE